MLSPDCRSNSQPSQLGGGAHILDPVLVTARPGPELHSGASGRAPSPVRPGVPGLSTLPFPAAWKPGYGRGPAPPRPPSGSVLPVPHTRCGCSRQTRGRLAHRLPRESPGLALTGSRRCLTAAPGHGPAAPRHGTRVLCSDRGAPSPGPAARPRAKLRSSSEPSAMPACSAGVFLIRAAAGGGAGGAFHRCGSSGATRADEAEDIRNIPDTLPEMSES